MDHNGKPSYGTSPGSTASPRDLLVESSPRVVVGTNNRTSRMALRQALQDHSTTQTRDWEKLQQETKAQLDKLSQETAQATQKTAQSSEEQVAQLKQQLEALQQQYTTDIQALKQQLSVQTPPVGTTTTQPQLTLPLPDTAQAITAPAPEPPLMPTTANNNKTPPPTSTETNSPYAYVLMNWKLNPTKSFKYRAYLSNMLLTAKILRTHGSTADIVAIFRFDNIVIDERLPAQDEALLHALGIKIRYLPMETPYDFNSRRDTKYLRKFHTYSMIEYRRVLVLDGDLLPITNLDYLFELSDAEYHPDKHIPVSAQLKPYVVIAGINEPSNGGFFLATPNMDYYNRVQELIQTNWETAGIIPKFDRVNGWGHPFHVAEGDKWEHNIGDGTRWDFLGAWCDQGLHYHMTKYEIQNVTQLFARKIVHWGKAPNNGTTIAEQVIPVTSRLQSPLVNYSKVQYNIFPSECGKWTGKRKGNWPGCVPPYSDFEHFSGKGKAWTMKVPEDIWDDMDTQPKSTRHLWWQVLYQLKVEDGLDILPLLDAINPDTDWEQALLKGPPPKADKTETG
ncbi:Glycogenin [Seminavis robusta]|uniref:Glycogenin n=1 Tax=Seminavis robusta TaxID=568900 RepID=A0A9N8HSB1_9STRA|nr:Glycogenin [Seminavis robusta]|eukprot:Sro1420_g271120.1 Glycogenin (564) ;mRNA; r:12028-14054